MGKGITVAARKNKGRKAQQSYAKLLLDIAREAGYDLEPDDIRSTPLGVTGPDLTLSPKAQRIFFFDAESKNHASINVISVFWELVEKNKRPTIALFKRTDGKNRSRSRPEMFCMDGSTLAKLLVKALKYDRMIEENNVKEANQDGKS